MRIKEKHPLTKPFLAEFASNHPEEYRKFRASLDRHAAVGVRSLVEAKGGTFNETAFSSGLIDAHRRFQRVDETQTIITT